ncbi:MAG: DUF512 domain-containing protein [Acidimicrobiia bacterium]
MSYPTILEVVPGSSAAIAGLAPGDQLLALNGVRPADVIEYQQLADEPDPAVQIRRDGITLDVAIDKRAGEPLGVRLNASIFDRVQTCDNHCEFCFIYQLPPGMRRSLYLKDDDYRLSFLYGNFTTLTRFTELDLARTVEEGLGPLYVSIHATDPGVRAGMLRNDRGATSLRWLRALLEAGVTIHGQIVLCGTVNGGDVLDRTCVEIIARYPSLASVGVVPLGLSRYNRADRLRIHTSEEAARDLEIVHRWQEAALERLGTRMFHASDELYLTAGCEIPPAEVYEGFPQHENGIGMVRALYDDLDRIESGNSAPPRLVTGEWRSIWSAPAWGYRADRTRAEAPAGTRPGPAVVVTGEYGARVLAPQQQRLERLSGREIRILSVPNRFFGGNVAVAGLMVGEDVRTAIATDDQPAGVYVLPDVALRGDVFLDDVELESVMQATATPVRVVTADAAGLISGLVE